MTKELLARYPEICEELAAAEKAGDGGALLSQEKREIESFVAGLPYRKRALAQAVMKHGARWDVVRRALHSHKSADALRMEYHRIFEKN